MSDHERYDTDTVLGFKQRGTNDAGVMKDDKSSLKPNPGPVVHDPP